MIKNAQIAFSLDFDCVFNQSAMYGPGIYLSSELHVSLMFSPTGCGWEKSRCGKRSTCLAICEFINHPNHLKCQAKGMYEKLVLFLIKLQLEIGNRFYLFSLKKLEKNKRSDVPDKYFLVTNNEIVRVRYLIVYGTDMKNSERANLPNRSRDHLANPIVQWTLRHKWLAAMAIYAIILAILGASNSRHGHYMRKFVWKAMHKAMNYVKTLQLIGFDLLQKLFD